jgi:hypothetical protein
MPDRCWEWTGARTPAGYGIIQARAFSKKPFLVHRIVLEMKLDRSLKENEETIHICDNPACNNPDHLIVGSHADNMHDAQNKNRLKIGGRTSGTWTTNNAPSIAGENHFMVKLNQNDVDIIRKRNRAGESATAIAKDYPVSITQICRIISYKSWKCLK